MSGTSADAGPLTPARGGVLDAAARFLGGASFGAFFPALLVFFTLGMAALLVLPTAVPAVGAFAADFRTWCFGFDPHTGAARWAWVVAMLTSPLLLAGLVTLAWWPPLAAAFARRRSALIPPILAAAVTTLAGAAAAYALSGPAPPLTAADLAFPAEDLRTALPLPDISLVDHEGRTVTLAEHAGEVVVLTSVFARCGATCPLILQQARRVVEQLTPRERSELTVLSISMDSAHDTPPVLGELFARHQLDPAVFHLGTGEPAVIEPLLDRLDFARQRDETGGFLTHANLFLLVDRSGRLAYRFSIGELQEAWMTDALRLLLSESAPPQGALGAPAPAPGA